VTVPIFITLNLMNYLQQEPGNNLDIFYIKKKNSAGRANPRIYVTPPAPQLRLQNMDKRP
jgi:hypothetical protein